MVWAGVLTEQKTPVTEIQGKRYKLKNCIALYTNHQGYRKELSLIKMPDLPKISQPGTCARSGSTNAFVPVLKPMPMPMPNAQCNIAKNKRIQIVLFLVFRRFHGFFCAFCSLDTPMPELNDGSVLPLQLQEQPAFCLETWFAFSFVMVVRARKVPSSSM